MGRRTDAMDFPAVYEIAGRHAADRLLASQALWPGILYLRGQQPPTAQQVSAVLRALADHTIQARWMTPEVRMLGRDTGLGDEWRQASGISRYLRGMGDWLDGSDQ